MYYNWKRLQVVLLWLLQKSAFKENDYKNNLNIEQQLLNYIQCKGFQTRENSSFMKTCSCSDDQSATTTDARSILECTSAMDEGRFSVLPSFMMSKISFVLNMSHTFIHIVLPSAAVRHGDRAEIFDYPFFWLMQLLSAQPATRCFRPQQKGEGPGPTEPLGP